MNGQALHYFPYPWLACIALVLFSSVFLSVILKVGSRSREAYYKKMSQIPLDQTKEVDVL